MNLPPNHSIVFFVSEDGELTAEVEGVSGSACDTLLDILKEAGVVQSEEATPDRDKPEPQARSTTQRKEIAY